jgi:hypothetical protein
VPGAKPKRATEDQLSQISKAQRGAGKTAIQKSFLDDSKVNKHLARELMNAKPIFSVQEIQGGQAQLNGGGGNKTQKLAPVPGISHQRNTSMA